MKNRKAVTLVEIMIAMLLFGIVLAVGYALINRSFTSLDRQRQSLDTLHEARDFLMIVERDLREMIEVEELDTLFKKTLFDEQNALMYKLVIVVPSIEDISDKVPVLTLILFSKKAKTFLFLF